MSALQSPDTEPSRLDGPARLPIRCTTDVGNILLCALPLVKGNHGWTCISKQWHKAAALRCPLTSPHIHPRLKTLPLPTNHCRWAVGPSAFPCAGCSPLQRPPLRQAMPRWRRVAGELPAPPVTRPCRAAKPPPATTSGGDLVPAFSRPKTQVHQSRSVTTHRRGFGPGVFVCRRPPAKARDPNHRTEFQ